MAKELTQAPEGYDSVMGAKATEEESSFFKVCMNTILNFSLILYKLVLGELNFISEICNL